jgi:hypothetical protein
MMPIGKKVVVQSGARELGSHDRNNGVERCPLCGTKLTKDLGGAVYNLRSRTAQQPREVIFSTAERSGQMPFLRALRSNHGPLLGELLPGRRC